MHKINLKLFFSFTIINSISFVFYICWYKRGTSYFTLCSRYYGVVYNL